MRFSQVDQRLLVQSLRKEADRQKRNLDAWDPTPKVRPMYGDADIKRSTAVPGPGAHSPRLAAVEQSFGTTFAASQFRVGQEFDRGAGSPDRWKLKGAADQPGPASYTLQSPRGGDHNKPGRSFGLPPELQASWQGDTPVPDAHDMNRMVRHLRDLPAPDAYSPRNSKQGPLPNKAFRMQPSKTLTPLEVEMKEAGAKPGPGQYEPSLPAGRSTMIGGSGELTSEIDRIMKASAHVPGPGKYTHYSQLRGTGAPKFGKGSVPSFIEQVMKDSKKCPGPGGSLFVTPTFKEELERRKYMSSIVKGD